MTDTSTDLQEWHCPGSRRVGASRFGASARCPDCGKRLGERTDGLLPLHSPPGVYHPSRKPKPKPPSTLAVIRAAYAEYQDALARREHGGVAAARFITAVSTALEAGA